MIKILPVTALLSLLPLAAAAQGLPSEPVQLFEGRVRIGQHDVTLELEKFEGK